VTTNSNDATTFKPYNASQISGSTTPSLPTIAPPPPPTSQHCNVVAAIIVIAVTIVVTYLTAGATSNLLAAEISSTFAESVAGTAIAASVGAAAGNAAGQVTGNIEGIHHGFDFGAVVQSGITAGVTAGLSSSIASGTSVLADSTASNGLSVYGNAAVAAAGYVVNDAAGKALNEPSSFSWKGLVAISAGAAVAGQIGATKADVQGGELGTAFVDSVLARGAQDVVTRETSLALGDGHVQSWQAIGEDVAGSAIAYAAAPYAREALQSLKNPQPSGTTLGANGNDLPAVPFASNAPLIYAGDLDTSIEGLPPGQPALNVRPYAGNSAPDPDVAMAQAAWGNQSEWTAYVDTSGMGANTEEPGRPPLEVVVTGKLVQPSPTGVYTLNQGDGPPPVSTATSEQTTTTADPSQALDLQPVTVTAEAPAPYTSYFPNVFGYSSAVQNLKIEAMDTKPGSAADRDVQRRLMLAEVFSNNPAEQSEGSALAHQLARADQVKELADNGGHLLPQVKVWDPDAEAANRARMAVGAGGIFVGAPVAVASAMGATGRQQELVAQLSAGAFMAKAAQMSIPEDGIVAKPVWGDADYVTPEQEAFNNLLGTSGSWGPVQGEVPPKLVGYGGPASAPVPFTGNAGTALALEGGGAIDLALGWEPAAVPNSGPQISNVRTISSAEANAPFISDAGTAQGWYPPYAEGPGVRTFATADDLPFVRLHTEEGNAPGGFLVRQEEISHLGNDSAAIRNYLGLKDTPAYISDVTVPAGTKMQGGIIGPQPNFGLFKNSGMQYQLLEQIPRSSFYNTRPLQ